MKKIFYEFSNCKQHSEFETFIKEIVLDKSKRESFYNNLIQSGLNINDDIFKSYFEEYSAERKSAMQDFTPTKLSELLTKLTGGCDIIYDPTAGTGGLVIEKWKENKNAIIQCEEYSNNVIPYLIHNLAIKNAFATILHIDTLSRECKSVYVLEQSNNFSDIIILDKNETNAILHNVSKWV